MRSCDACAPFRRTRRCVFNKKVTENPYDNFDWKSLLTLMAYGSVRVAAAYTAAAVDVENTDNA
jgi:hypothetical protein